MLSLIVHGGAWNIPNDMLEAHRRGVARAIDIGWKILKNNGSAVEAVEQVVRYLEDDETFNAGRGSHLNAAGEVELDASIMNGRTFRCGAVAAVRNIKNPISLARIVMEKSEHILLVSTSAERFAVENGIELCDTNNLVTERERKLWQRSRDAQSFITKDAFRRVEKCSDTVGAVAMDFREDICVGTSTGGTFNKYPGRVGDSPLIGCGSYADNAIGGVSTTGWGEAIIKVVLAKTVIDLLALNGGNAQSAAEKGIEQLKKKVDGYGGLIVMNAKGEFGVAYNTPRMARAYLNETMAEPFVAI